MKLWPPPTGFWELREWVIRLLLGAAVVAFLVILTYDLLTAL